MSLSYHLLGRNAIHNSTSISTAPLVDLALGLPGMSTLLIAESVVYVILKSAMHSCKFRTVLWHSKQLWLFFTVFLQITNTGIYEKQQENTKNPTTKANFKKSQYSTTQTALSRALAFFLLKKVWMLPCQSAWFMAVLFCFFVLILGWPILRFFENVPWSLILLKRHSVQRPKQEIAYEKLHVQPLHLSRRAYIVPFSPPHVSDQAFLMS